MPKKYIIPILVLILATTTIAGTLPTKRSDWLPWLRQQAYIVAGLQETDPTAWGLRARRSHWVPTVELALDASEDGQWSAMESAAEEDAVRLRTPAMVLPTTDRGERSLQAGASLRFKWDLPAAVYHNEERYLLQEQQRWHDRRAELEYSLYEAWRTWNRLDFALQHAAASTQPVDPVWQHETELNRTIARDQVDALTGNALSRLVKEQVLD